ncbi:MAG: succinate dehydrogenase [Clostridia bacterium]|nr:succinate dehydrogenase [Clostridia bacterium]
MNVELTILRRSDPSSAPWVQRFTLELPEDASVADALTALNARTPLTDAEGKPAQPVGWQCSCMEQKCGACAMRINGVPKLACSTFLRALNGRARLEPLSKFPVVRDLIVDRSAVFEQLTNAKAWLQGEAQQRENTHAPRYQSARCLMCGCCLEVCPNFHARAPFGGAMAAVNDYRAMENETDAASRAEKRRAYGKTYYSVCGGSLSCHDICPIGIPVEELMVRANRLYLRNK